MMKIRLDLRNKTKELISSMLPEQKMAVLEYMESFLTLPEEEAFQEMLKLKIFPEDILSSNKKLERIETLSRMCGDICINYKKLHLNSWLSDEDYPSYLIKEFGNDKTLLALIKRRVSRRLDSPKPLDMARLQFLLNSEEEKNRFGGLRELKFTNEEAQLFKNKTSAISQYICEVNSKTFCEETKKKESTTEIEEVDSIPEVSKETASEPIAKRHHLSAANVIANSGIIKKFLSDYETIKKESKSLIDLGIDPEEILKNAASVSILLSAAENL